MEYKFDQIAYNLTAHRLPTKEDMKYYIGLEHLESGSLDVHEYGSAVEIKGEKLIMTKGDILLGKRNAYLRRAAIAPHDGLFSAHGMILRPKENVIDKDFFPFFIASDIFFDEAIRISVGGLSPTINWKDLKELSFNLPPLSEQKLLADKLWAAYRVKESYRKLLSATDDMVKAKFVEMFGDADTANNRVSFEEAFEIRDNLRKPLNDTVRSGMHDGTLYPYYGANGLVDRINQYMIDMTALCLAEDCGDFAAGGQSAYIISGKSWVNNHAHILVPKPCCQIEYAEMLFKIMDLSLFVDNDNRQKLTQANMRKIKILLPPLALQQQFVTLATQAEATKASLRQSIESIDKVIRSLINQ